MKTAMQELLDELKEYQLEFNIPIEVIDMCESQLNVEKEQIMNAYCDGAKGGANGTKGQHENGWVSIQMRNKYYNQTYNQKIPELLYKDGTPMRKVKLGKEAEELLDEATKRFNQPNL